MHGTGGSANTRENESSGDRLLAAFALYTVEHPEWNVEDAAKKLGVSQPTAYRYFKRLTGAGLITPVSGAGYTLGPAIIQLDRHGVIRRQYRVGHAQTACIGEFRPESPGLEYAAVNFWRNPGIVTLLNSDGELLQQDEPIHSGSPMLPVNWRGDGREFILLSGNIREGGLVDGQLRRVVMFPDDGHPDLCAAVLNLTGDPRDEIVLWDQDEVWIYTQDKPFAGERMYAPMRNPLYNDSNYRVSVSWPAWQDIAPVPAASR